MGDKVSIIVPAYNVATYISECIESIIGQTYVDIELLIINDGSTDDTKNTCEKYTEFDRRVKLVNSSNQGVSTARNIGLSLATGGYVMFVDGDDWLEPTAVETLLNEIKEQSADICFSTQYYKDLDKLTMATYLPTKSVYSAFDLLNQHVRYNFISSPCFSLISKAVIAGCNFKTDIHTLEDWEFNFQILANAKKVYLTDYAYYHYRSVNGSASKSPLNGKKISALKIIDSINDYIEADKSLSVLDTIFIPSFLIHHLSVVYAINGSVDNAHLTLRQFGRKNLLRILKSHKLPLNQKLMSVLTSLSPRLFRSFFRIKYSYPHYK